MKLNLDYLKIALLNSDGGTYFLFFALLILIFVCIYLLFYKIIDNQDISIIRMEQRNFKNNYFNHHKIF